MEPNQTAPAPTVGRIVHLYVETDNGSLDTHAAIVTKVHGPTCVNLCVFDPSGGTHHKTSVELGTLAGQWTWPARN